MNSMKNAVVVVLLLGVAYGAYTVINTPDPNMDEDPETLAAVEGGIQLEFPSEDSAEQTGSFNGAADFSSSLDTDAGTSQNRSNLVSQPPPTQPRNSSNSKQLAPPDLQPPSFSSRFDDSQNHSQNRSTDLTPPSFDEPDLSISNSQTGFDARPRTDIVPIQPNRTAESNTTNLGSPSTTTPQLNWNRLQRLVSENENYRGALTLLSRYHRANPNSPERNQVLQWLDGLAGRVIYSPEHNLLPNAYVVKQGDTLQSLAQRWKIPAELIYQINAAQISNPQSLTPGTELKVVNGPFNAEIDSVNNELTLYLGEMYAARFPIEFGVDARISKNEFQVQAKSDQGRVYQDPATRQTYRIADMNNPYGKYWIGLDESTCLHSVSNVADNRGCIRLSDKHAMELFSILSTDSKIIVR